MRYKDDMTIPFFPPVLGFPASQRPETITQGKFKKAYSDAMKRFPFSEAYLGEKNPFTGHVIKSEEDYRLFLREYVYYSFCREYERKALESEEDAEIAIAEINLENQAAEQKYLGQVAEAEARAKRAEKIAGHACLEKENAIRQAQTVQASKKKLHRVYLFFLVIFLTVGFMAGQYFQTAGQSAAALEDARTEGFSEGYESGKADGAKERNAASYNEGRTAGLAEGKKSGYSEGYAAGKDFGYERGYNKGYREGKKDGKAEAETTAASETSGYTGSYSGVGSTRADPVFQTYIGNVNSKKFHLPTCSYLPDPQNQVPFASREAAIAAGYVPCGHCNP